MQIFCENFKFIFSNLMLSLYLEMHSVKYGSLTGKEIYINHGGQTNFQATQEIYLGREF